MKVVVIGSGPGGYVAAIRCAQLGMEVTVVEKYPVLGGTCLNVGCIPSKALLDSSEHAHFFKANAQLHGLHAESLRVDFQQMMQRKRDVVSQNAQGVEYLLRKNKVRWKQGLASFHDETSLEVRNPDGMVERIDFDRCIIATGSKPVLPESFHFDGERVISSTEALELDEIPQRMVVIGGGVIGLELGSVYARLGTQVEVIEYAEGILPGMDRDGARALQKSLQGLGMVFHTGHAVQNVARKGDRVVVRYRTLNATEDTVADADYCLVAVGRKPYTTGLAPERAGIALDDKGRIVTDAELQTKARGVYAIGDVVSGPMLAHKAEEEGIFVAEIIAGQRPHLRYDLIPGVVYTWPEMAAVGRTEEQLRAEGIAFKTGKYPFKALGRARTSGDLDGLVKILADQQTDEILGAHIVGARAADLIMEMAVAMEFRAACEDIARTSHPHPTYSEAIREAALDALEKRAIHQ
ncbi:MAG: dihydrolipoyl dehydrogenase [Saprospiraceae bacterium]|jgi:dihydrolipoamide dehydrogenase|nr:dihydrolipoyl dehydrogenase [Saprospiraceae bacterium]MBP9210343.1 dihydrolipoyl dehydrogenase [Saprospiraceae bacterium]MBV6474040.1 Dihydrolipoyl dehydrogenase 3 [Saprospiraceae bacterium]